MTENPKPALDLERLTAILAREARGEALSPEDAELRRHAEEEDPALGDEAPLWAALGELGAARGDDRELSDAAMLERVLTDARALPLPLPVPMRAKPTASRRRAVAGAIVGVGLAATLLVAFAADALRDHAKAPALTPSESVASSQRLAPPMAPSSQLTLPLAPPEASTEAPLPRPAAEAIAPEAPRAAPGEGQTEAPRAVRAHEEREARAQEPLPSADELLQRAQSALGAGKSAEAMAAYQGLLRRYPSSAEARAALVSLGQLALGRGDALEALGYFNRYLAGNGGPLAVEARVGRIQSLRKLGRAADELAAIQDFLSRHEGSVHAARLRARATELSGE